MLVYGRIVGSVQKITDPDPDPKGPKTYRSYGSGTLVAHFPIASFSAMSSATA
jgi:hypothetical protein